MSELITKTIRFVLCAFFLIGAFFLYAGTSYAQRPGCPTTFVKQAEGAGDLLFDFRAEIPGGDGEIFSLRDGESRSGVLFPGEVFNITEEPTPGWILADVVCEGGSGIAIDDIPGGIQVECVEPGGETVVCTFINVRPVSQIPTLSEWGMIAAAAGLGLMSLFYAVRRRRAVSV